MARIRLRSALVSEAAAACIPVATLALDSTVAIAYSELVDLPGLRGGTVTALRRRGLRVDNPLAAGREQPARPPWDVDEAADSRLGRLRRRDCAQTLEGLALELAAALLADTE